MHLIERPPRLFRMLFPGCSFRVPSKGKELFLTFDDGPIPEVTPQVLDLLDRYGIQATFFMVGDNARKYPELVEEVRRRGHDIGNHTMHHLQGAKVSTRRYLRDVTEAEELLESNLFRPPHGWLRPRQAKALRRRYSIVMYDLVSRDYSRKLTAEQVRDNVLNLARPGSIIVFHDSLKSQPRLFKALTESIEGLRERGYTFGKLSSYFTENK